MNGARLSRNKSCFKTIGSAASTASICRNRRSRSYHAEVRAAAALLMAASIAAGCDQREDRAPGNAIAETKIAAVAKCKPSPATAKNALFLKSVKIIDFDGTRMFIPDSWIKGYFDDGRSKSDSVFRAVVADAITPAINSGECPGIVHHFKVGERASRHGAISLSIKGTLPLSGDDKKRNLGEAIQIFVGARRRSEAGNPIRPQDDFDVAAPAKGWVKYRNFPMYKYLGKDAEFPYGCTARYDEIDSSWIIYRWINPLIGIGFVVYNNDLNPDSELVRFCSLANSLFDWLTTNPNDRSPSFLLENSNDAD